MQIIRTNLEFINNYDEISKICNKDKQMVYITKDGKKRFSCDEYWWMWEINKNNEVIWGKLNNEKLIILISFF